MATLILTAVGTAIGGPIGGAIGAILGQQVDQRLFAPKGRRGPRLNDLAVQTSSYGADIPKLFGAMRVAGSVVWATDLNEERRRQGGGKGRPKTTTYSYSASFAVLLSARPIVRVGRIWADGKLLRGAAGDFKTETGFRLHNGGPDQPPDPLIASAEGIATTPAWRGHAYAVFEDFQLGDYGNRIPSLSFEVIADEGGASAGSIVRALTGEASDSTQRIDGFAASGDSVRAVLESLAVVTPLRVRDDHGRLTIGAAPRASIGLSREELGASADATAAERLPVTRRPVASIPEAVALSFHDPARDYQPGLQRARRDPAARREARIEIAASLSAGEAKRLAEARLARDWAERETASVKLPWRRLGLAPGDSVVIEDAGVWRVTGVSLDRMVVELVLVREESASIVPVATDPGRAIAEPDLPHGPTILAALDLPQLTDGVASAPQLAVAAAGLLPGWRRAALLTSSDGGATWRDAGGTAAPAIIGTTATELASASPMITDLANSVDIDLPHGAMTLPSADDAALDGGANLAMLGNELIQFGSAEPVGAGRWRLSRLRRGVRGSEWAIADHATGERFVLIEREALAPIDAADAVAGLRVMAVGVADAIAPPIASFATAECAIRPLPPVHASVTRAASGDIALRWVRRSRDGWRWRDGTDAPLAEEAERYRITLSPFGLAARHYEVAVPEWVYGAADRAADAAVGATGAVVSIAQIGTHGVSRGAQVTLAY